VSVGLGPGWVDTQADTDESMTVFLSTALAGRLRMLAWTRPALCPRSPPAGAVGTRPQRVTVKAATHLADRVAHDRPQGSTASTRSYPLTHAQGLRWAAAEKVGRSTSRAN
jgi:hypothetical protein